MLKVALVDISVILPATVYEFKKKPSQELHIPKILSPF